MHATSRISRMTATAPLAALRSSLTLLALTLIATACQTTRNKALDHVKAGQTKTSVLESLGGPDRRIREEGKDRWIYVFYNKDVDNPQWKEIQFINNKVTYIGDQIKPELTAEQIDRKNEEANREEQARLNEEQKVNDRRLGRINSPAYGPSKTVNDEGDLEVEKHKKAPNFVPIQ